MSEHKPCPFCGNSHTRSSIDDEDDVARYGKIECDICGATVWGTGVICGTDDDDDASDAELIREAWHFWDNRKEGRT